MVMFWHHTRTTPSSLLRPFCFRPWHSDMIYSKLLSALACLSGEVDTASTAARDLCPPSRGIHSFCRRCASSCTGSHYRTPLSRWMTMPFPHSFPRFVSICVFDRPSFHPRKHFVFGTPTSNPHSCASSLAEIVWLLHEQHNITLNSNLAPKSDCVALSVPVLG